LAPDAAGQVHNGADDNASGTAALLEVARRMAASSSRPRPDVLFIAFTGEEKGLWGAGHYVKNPTLPIERTVAMINMDMIGRLGEGKLTIFGVATAEEWPELVEEVIAETDPTLPFVTAPDGFGPSDHSAFYGAGIPVLHFFTNTHADYHRPSDDWDRIDGVGLERVTAVVRAMTERLAGIDHPEAVALTPLSGAGDPSSGGVSSPDAPQQVSQSRGYGPYLGSIPDMTPQEGNGVRLTGVREASPAQLAGLRSGDVIVAFGGKEVTDLYAYTFALREHKPGDEVEIVVLRDGESVTLTAVLGRR
jgi:membrane-associated protease RseP (regulator of RpoE activity)